MFFLLQQLLAIFLLLPGSSRLVEELASLRRLSLHFRFCMDALFKDSSDAQIQDENRKDMSDLTIIVSTWSSCLANRAEFDGENMVSGEQLYRQMF